MKDQSPKSLIPDPEDQDILTDQGLWEQADSANQEWRDAPVDENESGVWQQADLANQEWRDAPTDENESGVWQQAALVNQEWRDAPEDENESEVWQQTALVNQEWQDAPEDENEAGAWQQAALVNQEWQDAPEDENEAGAWDQTPISESEWIEAPTKDEEEDKQQDGMIFLPKMVENLSYPLLPLIGFSFLGLSLFDHINILYPIKISEPVWIVETLGQITERIPTLWIGLLLVFLRREGYIRKWEVGVLKFLSWLALVLAIIYLLMTPMLIGNTVRVYRLIDTQIEGRASDQSEKLKKARDQISLTSEQDISRYMQSRGGGANLSPEQFRENLLLQADKNLSELAINTKTLKDSQLGELVKKTLKWSAGNLLSTFVCVWIWYLSRWTRIKNLELDSKL